MSVFSPQVHLPLCRIDIKVLDATRPECSGLNRHAPRSMRSVCSMLHYKCRHVVAVAYPRVPDVLRLPVKDLQVPWSTEWPEYAPADFTSPGVLGKPWADPHIGAPGFSPAYNTLDGDVDRRSHCGEYKVVDGRPLNPRGRTGLAGRGILGRWGPNHAADPIVTRWHPDKTNHPVSGKPILQFVAIQRRDSGEWALPGGMVDPGETVTATLRREFMEEAMNVLENPDQQRLIGDFLSAGVEVYRGYVDDPRNTDNSWMETVASHFHDEEGNGVGALPLEAGDDAVRVRWTDLSAELELYASHSQLLEAVAQKMNAHWTS